MDESKDFKKIEEFLKSLDYLTQQADEMEISERIKKFAEQEYGENWGESIPVILRAETMAFDFMENYTNPEIGWGTYYGPIMTFNDQKRGYIEIPSIKDITPLMIDY